MLRIGSAPVLGFIKGRWLLGCGTCNLRSDHQRALVLAYCCLAAVLGFLIISQQSCTFSLPFLIPKGQKSWDRTFPCHSVSWRGGSDLKGYSPHAPSLFLTDSLPAASLGLKMLHTLGGGRNQSPGDECRQQEATVKQSSEWMRFPTPSAASSFGEAGNAFSKYNQGKLFKIRLP